MKWIEKHINGFFYLNGVLLILEVICGIWAMYLMVGIPHNRPSTWTTAQWDLINFLWPGLLIYSTIDILFAALCFMKKYFIFPIILFYMVFLEPNSAIMNLDQIIKFGMLLPASNIGYLIDIVVFIFAIFSTILWVAKLRRR